MTKFETIEDVRAYWEKNPDEAWEDDDGDKYKILSVGNEAVFYRRSEGGEFALRLSAWLSANNLPQSLRNKPKPEPRKVPEFWEVRAWGEHYTFARVDLSMVEPELVNYDHFDCVRYRKEGDTDWIWLKGGE